MNAWEQGFASIASALSATVVNALWQDALLVACVWLLLRAWPKVNAATRYVVWSVTLLAAIAIPVATTLTNFTPVRTIVSTATSSGWSASATPVAHHQTGAATGASNAIAPVPLIPERLRVTLSAPLAYTIFALWLVLAVYALVRLTIGLLRLEQLKRDALPLPIDYRDLMPQWLRANKGARDVRLCVSDETDVPVAVGLFDAMILIPRSLLDRLSEPEVDQICLHELAHLRRADDWTNSVQRVINALLGWNPAAQFIGQQLDLEREVACDDWVLSYVGKVRPYAMCLTKMAETAAWPRHTIPAPGVFATRKHISLRIERLLGVGRNIATNLAPAPAVAALAVVAAITLAIVLVAPSVAAAPVVTVAKQAPASKATMTRTVAAAPLESPTPTANPSPKPRIHVEVPATHVNIPAMHFTTPATHVNIPAMHLTTPATHVVVPATHVDVPATHVDVPATHVDVPATHVDVPATHVDVPATHVEVPATHIDVPGEHVEVPAVHVEVPATHVNVPKPKLEPAFNGKALADKISSTIASGVMAGLHGTSIAQGNSCIGCDYSGVNWSGRNLRRQSYTGADFSKANLQGVNFSESSFKGVDFSGANLSGASFRNAHLVSCDFSDANLSGVDFGGAKVEGCDFTRARLGSSQLRDVLNSCKGCDFSHTDLSGVDLSGVHSSGNDFSGADLRGVNFARAVLDSVDFSNAKLDGANFAGATLRGCDLSGVDLTHVDLSRAKLIGTDLQDR